MSDNGGGDREHWRDAPPPKLQQQDPEPTRAERRADQRGENARRKAMRPWYTKKRWIAAMVIGALIVLPALAGVGGDTGDTAETAAAHPCTYDVCDYYSGQTVALFADGAKFGELLEGDVIAAYATIDGTLDYETAMGMDTTTPLLTVQKVKYLPDGQ